jgi:hypothetical protein
LINASAVKNTVMIGSGPIDCWVLGMTSVGNRANILVDGQNIEARTDRPLQFYLNGLPRILVKFATSLLMLQHGYPFDRNVKNGALVAAGIFIPNSLWRMSLIKRMVARK